VLFLAYSNPIVSFGYGILTIFSSPSSSWDVPKLRLEDPIS